jgi:hypothetical protein
VQVATYSRKVGIKMVNRLLDKTRPLQIIHGFDSYIQNNETIKEDIESLLNSLLELGIGGIVTNVGFKDYMRSESQWEILKYGLKRAKELGLEIWLYDEKGYPSGSAGGLVLQGHPEYEALGLANYCQIISGPIIFNFDLPKSCSKFLTAVAIPLDSNNTPIIEKTINLTDFADPNGNLQWDAPIGNWLVCYFAERYMYEGTHAAGNVHAFRKYINVLDQNAVKRFIEITHEEYYKRLYKDIWNEIEAIFTDEPSLMTTYVWPLPEKYRGKIPIEDPLIFEDRPPAIPWAKNFLETFEKLKGYNLLPFLPHLYLDLNEEGKYIRQDYYEVVTYLYTEAFFKQIGTWCRNHRISFTGHILPEENLIMHAAFQGSIFPLLKNMDIPGIDMLSSDPKNILNGGGFIAPKLVSSIAHISGKNLVMSETSDWSEQNVSKKASLEEMIGTANLLYALGVNIITSYYDWKERKNTYRVYCDYIAQIGTKLKESSHICDIGVLYPIRSIWSNYFPIDKPFNTDEVPIILKDIATNFIDLCRFLLTNQLDFDIVDEESIIDSIISGGKLRIANEYYKIIICPPIDTIRASTLEKLLEFSKNGGVVIFTEMLPIRGASIEDTKKVQILLEEMFNNSLKVIFVKDLTSSLPQYLREFFAPDIKLTSPNKNILYTHRKKEDMDIYFIINNSPEKTDIYIKFSTINNNAEIFNPLTNTKKKIPLNGDYLELSVNGYEGEFISFMTKTEEKTYEK